MTDPPARVSSGVNSRVAGLIAVCCVLALFLSIEPALQSLLLQRCLVFLMAVAPGVVVGAACAGLGSVLMRRSGQLLMAGEKLVLSFGCGLGLMSILVAAVGFSGWLNNLTALLLAGVGLYAGIPLWIDTGRQLFTRQSSVQNSLCATNWALLGMIVIVLALVFGFALTPPVIFDVTEYHLGPWRDYAQPHGVIFGREPYNFYARFPFPVESIYFLGLTLAPYIDTAPKVVNALCVIACSVLGASFAWRSTGSLRAALISALGILTLPVMLDVSFDAMIDAPAALLVAGSFYLVIMPYLRESDDFAAETRLVIPAFFLMGSALTAKYTVAQVYLLPWCLTAGLVYHPLVKKAPGKFIIAIVLASLPVLVWYGKNALMYGNPLEPFFVRLFRPSDAAGIAREKFYIESHFPQSPLSLSYWITLLPRLNELTWLYLVGCAGWMFRSRRLALYQILVFSAISFLIWNTVRESQDRFLLPVMILITAAAVVGAFSFPLRWQQGFVGFSIVIFCGANLFQYALKFRESEALGYLLEFSAMVEDSPAPADPPSPRENYMEHNLGDLGKVLTGVRRMDPPPAKLLLVYEARPYLFHNPVGYNVVWDSSLLLDIIRECKSTGEARAALRKAGYTHMLVNRQELLRYIQQYARKSQLLRLGVHPGDDPRAAWTATEHPEDLYPPFYRDKDWTRLRPLVHDLLEEIDAHAIIKQGLPSPGVKVKALDIIVSPVDQ